MIQLVKVIFVTTKHFFIFKPFIAGILGVSTKSNVRSSNLVS